MDARKLELDGFGMCMPWLGRSKPGLLRGRLLLVDRSNAGSFHFLRQTVGRKEQNQSGQNTQTLHTDSFA